MKASKKLLAAMLTLGVASQSFATTYVYITGAQAFGNSVLAAIEHQLQATSTNYEYAYTGASGLSKAQQTIWHGYIDIGNPLPEEVIIKTTWNGSTAGIQLVANQNNVNFLTDAELPTPSAPGTYRTISSVITPLDSHPANAAPADTTAETVGVVYNPVGTYNYQFDDERVGAGGYVFVASKNAPFTNIAAHQARALYREGTVPLAFITGLDANQGSPLNSSTRVYATGRDPSSGARILSLLESGITHNGIYDLGGPANSIQQYQYSASPGARVLYPVPSPNPLNLLAGEDGNTSNGTLATTVLADGNTLSNFNGYYVSYLPSLDAGNAAGLGAVPLKFNGVAYSAETLRNGAYPIWAYERLFRVVADSSNNPVLSASQNGVLDAISDQLINVDATVLLGSLLVDRDDDGGYITPKY